MTYTQGCFFSGIGGFEEAGIRCGIESVWASEIDDFCVRVTSHHFPALKHKGDITQINGAELEPVDIVSGGSPCQGLSLAGKRKGLEDERSGLFLEMIRVIREMLEATNYEYPKAIVWENVPGAFSSNEGEDINRVLDEFENLGFIVDLNVLDAQYMGVPQRIRRIYAACLNANYIRKMKTNISYSIITQLLIEILLCILNVALSQYEKEPKNSVWKQKKLTEDGLKRKIKLFSIEERESLETLLKNWEEMSRTLLKEQFTLVNHSFQESNIMKNADIYKNEYLTEKEIEKLFGDILKSWKTLLDVLYKKENLYTTLIVSNQITNQIIYGCSNLLENIALLIGLLKNCYQNFYETVLYILAGRKVCINYARQRQTSCPLFDGMEWFYDWNNYIDLYTKGGELLERYFGGQSAAEVLLKSEGLSRHSKKGK